MKTVLSDVRTRMAPSPTGNLHIGTTYATMWSYLFAKHHNGTFILRIEDTDRERSKKEFEKNILEGLHWMGFDFEGPYHQMDRLDMYKKAVDRLLDEEKAYYCFCTKDELDQERKIRVVEKMPQVYSGKCRSLSDNEVATKKNSGIPWVIRHKLPQDRGVVEFDDLIHGNISVDSKLIGDMVIMRQSGVPLYNFAVVVDDIEMRITHVIRGDDHISNTPKQILFFEALGSSLPLFAHYPVILNQDRVGKLSKRTGSTSLDEFRKDGYLPEAIFNYLALLGWNTSSDQEIFSKDEIIAKFDIKDMNKSAAAWNQDKLDWMNGTYIRQLSISKLKSNIKSQMSKLHLKDQNFDEEILDKVILLAQTRMTTLNDFFTLTNFFFADIQVELSDTEKIVAKKLLASLSQLTDWRKGALLLALKQVLSSEKIKMPLLYKIITGQERGLPLPESLEILGKEKTIARLVHSTS